MKLYFLRHAEAEGGTFNDFDRRLTERGKRRTATAAQVMLRLGSKPTAIYSSPRLRAKETAEIVADVLGRDVTITDRLDFSFELEDVETLVNTHNEDDEVMFVGHNPSFAEVVGDLSGGDVVMKKGGLARVDVVGWASPIEGQLIWLIAPRVFDALGDE